ncbi:MAG TPA: hypothetical protein PK523_00060 [Elusimicrobiales bacterium]|nr:hypothetical protein [Elusimicrobiales bacterium]
MICPVRRTKALVLLLALCPVFAQAAAKKPGQTWEPSGETYFVLPLAQNVYYPANDREVSADAWGFGYRLPVGREGFSRSAALQLQRVSVRNAAIGVDGGFYLLEILAGGEYISPTNPAGFRLTASAMADFGLAGGDLFMAPMLTLGALYQVKNEYDQPSGPHLSLFYRFTEVHVGDAAGRAGKLRPVIGLRLGYAFPGFWVSK